MNTDFRLQTGFPHHSKTRRLTRGAPPHPGWSLVCLWAWAALHRPEGNLSDLSDADIERAAEWTGPPGELVRLLLEVGYLEGKPEIRKLHDWEHWQGWASHAKQRSETARRNVSKRWEMARQRQKNTGGNTGVYTNSNTPSPFPSPFPSPKEKEKAPRVEPNESIPTGGHVEEDVSKVLLRDRCQNCLRARKTTGLFCDYCAAQKAAR